MKVSLQFLSLVVCLLSFPTTVFSQRQDDGGARGAHCRVRLIDTLLVDRSNSTTHYAATIQVTIGFASNAPDDDEELLDIGQSLRLFTTTSNEALTFEHFAPVQQLYSNQKSMIATTRVPIDSPSIDVVFEKDNATNICGPPMAKLLDQRQCIDVLSARLNKKKKQTMISSSKVETAADNDDGKEEFTLSVTLKPTDTKIATTNVRLPPTDQIGWGLFTNDELIQDFTLLPTQNTTEKSHRLEYHGTVRMYTYSSPGGGPNNFDWLGLYVSAFDNTISERTCGTDVWVQLDEEEDEFAEINVGETSNGNNDDGTVALNCDNLTSKGKRNALVVTLLLVLASLSLVIL